MLMRNNQECYIVVPVAYFGVDRYYDNLDEIFLDHLERSQRILCVLCVLFAHYRVYYCVYTHVVHNVCMYLATQTPYLLEISSQSPAGPF